MTMFSDIFYSEGSFKILTEAKQADGSIMKIMAPFTQCDSENANGRIYSKDIMQREVDRVQKDIDEGRFLGTSDHPKSGATELDKVSHIVNKLEIDEKGQGWASLSILDTSAGKNLKTILKSGGTLGLSTRGFGEFDEKTKKVKENYRLSGLDIVSNPSYQKGIFNATNIFESMNLDLVEEKKINQSSIAGYSEEGYIVKNKIVEDLKEDSQWSRVTKQLFENEEDFDGTLEDYAIKNGLTIQCVLAVEDGIYEDYEQAMIKLKGNEQDIANGRKMNVTPDKPAEPKDYYEESKITKIDPAKRAETINKDREKPGLTERRIAMRKQVVLSGKIGQTAEEIDAMVEKLLSAQPAICEDSKKKRLLTESEAIEKTPEKRLGAKEAKRLAYKKSLNQLLVMGGWTNEQIAIAMDRSMAEYDRNGG